MAGFRRLRRIPSLKSRVARKKQGIKTTDYNIKGSKATSKENKQELAKDEDKIEGDKVKK